MFRRRGREQPALPFPGGREWEPPAGKDPAPGGGPAAAATAAAFEPTPLLGDDALIEEAPAGEAPRHLTAEEELVLTEEDLIAHPPPEAPPLPREAPSVKAAAETIGDFEREPGTLSSSGPHVRYPSD